MELLHRSSLGFGFNLTFPTCLIALALTTAAQAQMTDAQKAALKSSCRSDYMSNCMSVRPGGIEALQCLQKNMAKLSPACQTAVNATAPKPAPAAAAAPPPAPPPKAAAVPTQPPPAVVSAPPPPARLAGPARAAPRPAAVARTTPAPAAPPPSPAVTEPSPAPTAKQLNAIKVTCRGDFSRNCRGVPPGGAEAIACLQRHARKLAPNCKISLADIADSLPATPVAAVAPPPPAARRPNAPVVMTAVIGRACLRDLIRRCRNTGAGDGQKIACLMAHGPQLAPLCKAALKITDRVR